MDGGSKVPIVPSTLDPSSSYPSEPSHLYPPIMFLNINLLLLLSSLWHTVVRAGAESRGIEILLFYTAYRLDVEVSSAVARDEGKDPEKEKPWSMAKDARNQPSDFPGGQVPNDGRLGANFHAFTDSTASTGYSKAHGLTRIADPWNPTWQEVRDLVTWPPIPDPKKSPYSYSGFKPEKMLGDLATGQDLRIPNDPGKKGTKKNFFFDFDNMLAVIGKHCADLHDKKPQIAGPYMTQIRDLSVLAADARWKDAQSFKIDDVKKMLETENKRYNKANPKSIHGAVKTTTQAKPPFGNVEVLDVPKTIEGIKTHLGKGNKLGITRMTKALETFANAYTTAETSDDMDKIKSLQDISASTRDHISVFRQQKVLVRAIDKHLGGEEIGACEYPPVKTPTRF